MRERGTFFRWLAPRVTVIANLETFLFGYKDRRHALRTVVYLDPDTQRIVSVGESPSVLSRELPVFPESGTSTPDAPADRVIAKFVAYGIERTLGRRFTIRPILEFTIGDALVTALRGHAPIVLREAALDAGAMDVVFRDASLEHPP